MDTIKELAYEKYKLDKIAKTEEEDHVLLYANKLVRLKDERHINLFWDCHEEDRIRRYLDYIKQISN